MKTINSKSDVAILMATYNGSRFLREQIDSILNQTYENWNLFICDDDSTDDTIEIIREYSKKDSRIIIVNPKNKKQGAIYTFSYLLEHVNSKYYMFSDQDDIWLRNKIELSLDKINNVESNFSNLPIVIHTDLIVVDKDLHTVHSSFWKRSKIQPKILRSFNYIGICNCATGCTMIFNNLAKRCSVPIPEDANMHDWWIALCASKNGIIDFVDQPTILYRQHGNNVVGARNVDSKYFVNKLIKFKSTLAEHKRQYIFLRLAKWGNWLKFYYYKILYTLQRNIGN